MTENQPEDLAKKSDAVSKAAEVDQPGSAKLRLPQFGIAAMFWGTFLAGMVMAYLNRLNLPGYSDDSATVIIGAAISVLIGLSFGFLIGKVTKVKPDGENEIEIELAKDVRVRVVQSTIADVVNKTAPK